MKFRIEGQDRSTGENIASEIDAVDAFSARAAAEKLNMQITSILPLTEPPSEIISYQSLTTPTAARFVRPISIGILLLIEFVASFIFCRLTARSDEVIPGFLLVFIIVAIIQVVMLLPVTKPAIIPGRAKSVFTWLSAITLGLLVGIAILIAGFLTADLIWAAAVSTDELRDNIALVGLILAIVSWIVTTPLLAIFMKRGRPNSLLAKFSAALFLGTAVEFIACIPIMQMVRKRTDCECGTYTFWAILLSIAMGVLMLGPLILFLIAARRSRTVARGVCPVCGFNMNAQPQLDRCSNCGAGWKSSGDLDRKTMS